MYRVIIADDEFVIRQGIRKIIARFAPDWEVIGEAEDGVSALRQIFRLQPDLVILDFRMPGQNGLACCRAIAAQSPRIHRIILTAYPDFQLAKEAIHHGVLEFITKPLDRQELLEALRKSAVRIERERAHQGELRTLRRAVRQAEPLARQLYGQHALLGHDIQELEAFIVGAGAALPFDRETDRVIVLAVSPDWIERDAYSAFDIELFLYALTKCAQEWYADLDGTLVLQDQAAQVIVIARCAPGASADEAAAHAAAQAERLRADIAALFNRTVTVGVSAAHAFSSAPAAYREATLAVGYRYVYGGDRVLAVSRIQAEQELPELPLGQLEHSLTLLLQGREEPARGALEQAISAVALGPQGLKRLLVHYVLRLATELTQRGYAPGLDGKPWQTWLAELERSATRATLSERLGLLIGQVCRLVEPEQRPPDLAAAQKAQQYVRDYLGEGVSLQTAADYMGMNASYFSRWFKRAVGRNFVDYLKACRIEEAKRLLREEACTMQEISSRIGYADVKHFYRVFKDTVGCTPSEFKKRPDQPH
ncbi:response regulator [Paenibacillus sp. IB182496]|uniref:Response regulator n=1 Tax=Paenibacillus sabuli TaxID=2772509 RepID=A0A927GQJ1_9BACL|nr:response regulator [Paenibacillus sabuli]MBD2843945.1 response regulator [Paenibacillus sabuli]